MPDKVTKEKRSEIMSHIRGKDTAIEISVRKWLYAKGLRYRKNSKAIMGTPDLSIKKYKIAIFVNGCFWHGHENCKYYKLPQSNVEFWKEKIDRNIERDLKIVSSLENDGWLVILIWECELKKDFDGIMTEVYDLMLDRINSSLQRT